MNVISVVTTDKTGAVADITRLLSDQKIDIDAINVQVMAGDAVIHITAQEDQKALEILIGAGYQTITEETLLIRIEDVPGSLAAVSSKLAEQAINIRSMTMIQRNEGYNLVALSTDNNEKAATILDTIN